MAVKNTGRTFGRIIFPTDFSPSSENAARYAFMVARQNRATLHVLHIVDVSSEPAGFYVPHLSYEILDAEMEKAATDMLKAFCVKFFKGYKNLEQSVAVGVPYKAILKIFKDSGADLIVIGASGRGGVDKFLFGSTTERVMRKAGCPMLVIPPPK
ncbi:universal stress protein [bacterium]|nr:MAG: universal stress protein [bacterium]